jgi:predicted nucleic acid-binding protein
MKLLDASVFIAAHDVSDTEHEAAAKLLSAGDLFTIDLAAYEVINWAELKFRRPDVGDSLRALFTAIEAEGRMVRWDSQMLASLARAMRDHAQLTSYDAAYVAAAKRLDVQLVSCDVRDLVGSGLAVLPSTIT